MKDREIMRWTPHGLIPLDFRIAGAGVGGEGETTIGQALLEGAVATYGPGFVKEVIWDRGYLDGPWLAEEGEPDEDGVGRRVDDLVVLVRQ